MSSANIEEVTTLSFLSQLRREGAGFFVFVEYVPIKEGSEALLLGDAGRLLLRKRVEYLRRKFALPLLAFPGDEGKFGGCLAAGRGFIHLNPRGALEPCPFAPFSDTNLESGSLRQALSSAFLERIREAHSALTESGGCALWANKDWVAGLLAQSESAVKAG